MFGLEEVHAQIDGQTPDLIAQLRAKVASRDVDVPRREAGYTIQALDGASVVRIYDEIWSLGVNALDLVADLDAIDTPEIRVEINSPGGNVFDGIAIYNALRMHPAKVTTRVDGIAASIASVIAQAGDHRVMVDSSQMMIHNAWGLSVGNASDHEEMAAILSHQDGIIAGIYASKSETPPDEFLSLMAAETWLTAQAAVDLGLADEVYTPKAPAKASLVDEIETTAGAVRSVIEGVERLVATHADAESPLTGAKRDGLVALREAVVRIDDLLQDGDAEVHPDLAAMRDAAVARSYARLRR